MVADEPQSFRSRSASNQNPLRSIFIAGVRRTFLHALSLYAALGLCALRGGAATSESAASKDLHPRPSGYNEAGAPAEKQELRFQPVEVFASLPYDLVAHFPKDTATAFEVKRVTVNGVEQSDYLVENHGVFNGHKRVHGSEDFTVSVFANWQPTIKYPKPNMNLNQSASCRQA